MIGVPEFLFALCDAGGNAPPMLGAVRRMVGQGHRVRVLADTSLKTAVERAGAVFHPWQRAPNRLDHSADSDVMRDWEADSPIKGLERLRDRMMIGPAAMHAADVLAVLEKHPVDAVVSSDLMFGPMIAAEAFRLPLAVLASNLCYLPIPGIPPFGPGLQPAVTDAERDRAAEMQAGMIHLLDSGLPTLNAARAGLGLPPLAHTLEQPAAARRFLLATCPAFDFPAERLPPTIRYVGPILDEPDWARADTPRTWAGETPLVLVAFSTTFQDQAAVIQRVLHAMVGLPVRVVVTLGPALDPTHLRADAGTVIVERASHDEILPHAALVVTHGGHGTVMRALAHGIPLLCLPMGRDQSDNAARVEAKGVGKHLDARADVADLAAAIRGLLDNPTFRANAAYLGAAIRRSMKSDALEEELCALREAGCRPA